MANKRIDIDAEIDRVRLEEQVGDPANPAAGYVYVYQKADGFYFKKDDSTVIGPLVSAETAAYAARSAAGNDGNLFLPNNGFVLERDTGTTWIPWGPIFPFTVPVNDDFVWINQGAANINVINGGIVLTAPVNAALSQKIRKKAAPEVPYTITAAIIPLSLSLAIPTCGIGWRQSSDGKIVTFQFVHQGALIGVAKFTNPTTWSANYDVQTISWSGSVLFLRIEDNNVNRICSFSNDGQTFYEFHSVGRTDFLTGDEVLFFADSQSAVAPSYMTLLSWKEE